MADATEVEELFLVAVQQHQNGDAVGAANGYERVLTLNSAHGDANYLLAEIERGKSNHPRAIRLYQTAIQQKPDWLEPALGLFQALHDIQRPDVAESILIQYLPAHKGDIRLHRACATQFHAAKRADKLEAALRAAASHPAATAEDHAKLADFFRSQGKFLSARDCYLAATHLNPNEERYVINGGGCLQELGNSSEACRWYEHAFGLGARGEYLISYANALRAAGQFTQWKIVADQIATNYHDALAALNQKIQVAQFFGEFEQVARYTDEAIQKCAVSDEDGLTEYAFFRLHFDQTAEQHKIFYSSINSKIATTTSMRPRTSVVSRKTRPLNVGYIGADFRDHVMGRMVLSALKHRDRQNQKVTIYAVNLENDSVTSHFRNLADRFQSVSNASDAEIAKQIVRDEIDVLIDLSGPTAGSRPRMLSLGPAPVVISHLASAGPIGLSAVDYKLTDSICDLPENQEYLIEKLLPMEGCCYPVPEYPLPTLGVSKQDLQLEGKVTIGAFYSYMKLSERCVKLWKRVLDEIPNGMLLFSPLDPKLNLAYENIMRAAEISADKFRFIPSGQTEAERLARYRVVDFVLDSMPYGGVNGTLEALYMGVPVITLLGKHHSERTSASMLTHLGVPDTIAQSPDEYVAMAKRLASESKWREDLSFRIRTRWPKFADPVYYARRWEALLRKVAH